MTRVFVSSTNASRINNTFTLQLPLPIENAIHLDIVASSLTGYLLQIDTWGENITSAGRLYWRFLDSDSNQRYLEWQKNPVFYKEPRTLREVVYSLWQKDSTPFNSAPADFAFEIMVYSASK